MNGNFHQKIKPHHLQRSAYLYVRQSTLKQVMENTESTERQYNLKNRAVALGWQVDEVITIDSDLGKSGATSANRDGFKKLVADVGMGQAGIVMGIEVSRLARNSSDWHRLLEICALTETLILDEEGIYDPSQFNDRLLLGLKGTMSEAELHVLKARLRGGLENKASKGELLMPLPVGFIHTLDEKIVKDPDKQVQETVATFFQTFERTGSASMIVKYFKQNGLLFPRRPRNISKQGILVWGKLTHWQALRLLHNPSYAGAYVFGRTRQQKTGDGKSTTKSLPIEQWRTLIQGHHAGYINWLQYTKNVQQLKENAQANGADRKKSPPREGSALIQGMTMCGKCGKRMTLRYHTRRGIPVPTYVCQSEGIQNGVPICQSISGGVVDIAIGNLVLERVSKSSLDIAIAVQQELESRTKEVDQLRKKKVDRSIYEADIAKSRFMQVDPNNRLVADTLEGEWNLKLKNLHSAQEEYESYKEAENLKLSKASQEKILEIAENFPKIWSNSKVPNLEKKRLLRLLIEDVTLLKESDIEIKIRFRGGKIETLSIPIPLAAPDLKRTPTVVIKKIDALLDHHTELKIASILNDEKIKTSMGKLFTRTLVSKLRRSHKLTNRYTRLRDRGFLEAEEIAIELNISPKTVGNWRREGLLRGVEVYTRKYLYALPKEGRPVKRQGIKLKERVKYDKLESNHTNEVQYEA